MNENINAGVPNPVEASQIMQGLCIAEGALSQLRQEMWTSQLGPVANRKGFYGHGEEPVLTQLDTLPTMKQEVARYRELGSWLGGVQSIRNDPTLLNRTDWANFARSVIQYYGHP